MYTFIHSVGYVISLGTYKTGVSSNIPTTQCSHLVNNSPNFLTAICVTVREPNKPAVLFGDWGRAEKLSKDIIDVSSHICACVLIVLFQIFIKLHCANCTTEYHKFSSSLDFAVLIYSLSLYILQFCSLRDYSY
jgi:hypothetical protein